MRNTRDKVIELYKSGVKASDISNNIVISRSRVYQCLGDDAWERHYKTLPDGLKQVFEIDKNNPDNRISDTRLMFALARHYTLNGKPKNVSDLVEMWKSGCLFKCKGYGVKANLRLGELLIKLGAIDDADGKTPLSS